MTDSHPTPPEPLDALRRATTVQHHRLDQGLRLARPDATLGDYAGHLACLHPWLSALAPWSDRLPVNLALPPVPRLARIELDLMDCRIPVPPMPTSLGERMRAAGAAADECAANSEGEEAVKAAGATRAVSEGCESFCWGVAYVIEGSALGGQVLYRRLLPVLAPHPLRYLAGDGAQTGARWKAFIAALRTRVTEPRQVRAACAGAIAAFDEFEWLCAQPAGCGTAVRGTVTSP